MVTMVGTQTNFIDAVYALIELDYDAAEAYQAAIDRLDNQDYKLALAKFKADHERHIAELSALLRKHNEKVPDGPDAKRFLAQGKVFLANLAGDKAILMAMHSNEVDTNTAYERVCKHESITPEFEAVVQKGWEDEKRHKAWIEQALA